MSEDRSQPDEELKRDRSILIVDNDKRIVDLLKEIFENMGFFVIVSYCGEAAIAKNREGKYFCAILDYSLPDLKGDELAKKLRIESPNMRIILLTGFKPFIDPVKLQTFNYIFEKPANLDDLIEAAKHILEDSKHLREHERQAQLSSFYITCHRSHS